MYWTFTENFTKWLMYNKIYVGMQDLSVGLIDAINMMMVFCESSSLPVS